MRLFGSIFPRQAGFTLTEVVSVLGLILLISLIVYNLFLISSRTFNLTDQRLEINQNARIFLDRITRELRQTSAIVTSLPPSKEEIGFPPSQEIMFQDGHDVLNIQYLRYYLDSSLIKRQRIVYYFPQEPGTYVVWNAEDEFGNQPESSVLEERIIAEYISQLYFYGSSLTSIEVWVAKKDSTTHLYTAIWGRNTRL